MMKKIRLLTLLYSMFKVFLIFKFLDVVDSLRAILRVFWISRLHEDDVQFSKMSIWTSETSRNLSTMSTMQCMQTEIDAIASIDESTKKRMWKQWCKKTIMTRNESHANMRTLITFSRIKKWQRSKWMQSWVENFSQSRLEMSWWLTIEFENEMLNEMTNEKSWLN